jgi:hypothetical protein
MKVLFEFDSKRFVMDSESAGEIVSLIHARGAEIYEHKKDYRTKEESHHVYNLNPAEIGTVRMNFITEELYGMGKLKGRPKED